MAYDDGDEEMLGEIDCRSDVRLLDSPREDDDVTALGVRFFPLSLNVSLDSFFYLFIACGANRGVITMGAITPHYGISGKSRISSPVTNKPTNQRAEISTLNPSFTIH